MHRVSKRERVREIKRDGEREGGIFYYIFLRKLKSTCPYAGVAVFVV